MAIEGSWEGRTSLNSLLERWANIMIQLLQMDPLKVGLGVSGFDEIECFKEERAFEMI